MRITEEGGQFNRTRTLLLEVADHEIRRITGADNLLEDEDVAPLDIEAEILRQFEMGLQRVDRLVTLFYRDEIKDVGLTNRAREVREKMGTPL